MCQTPAYFKDLWYFFGFQCVKLPYNQLLRIEEELAEDAVFVPEEITEKQKAEKMG